MRVEDRIAGIEAVFEHIIRVEDKVWVSEKLERHRLAGERPDKGFDEARRHSGGAAIGESLPQLQRAGARQRPGSSVR